MLLIFKYKKSLELKRQIKEGRKILIYIFFNEIILYKIF